MQKKIFTFWEPKESMPEYLKLCIATWKKFLPDYEIIVLNYDNLSKWIGKNYFDKTLYSDFSLPKIADAVRCAILYNEGGIWLDTDTIIISKKIQNILSIDSELVLVKNQLCMIVAKKRCDILKKWLNGILYYIWFHKMCKNKITRILLRVIDKASVSNRDCWSFLGNYILDELLPSNNSKKFYSIDKNNSNIFPEVNKYSDLSTMEAYIKFYFENDYSNEILLKNSGIVCLHNSWTPEYIKNMKADEFLNLNITLSKLLKHVLYESEG